MLFDLNGGRINIDDLIYAVNLESNVHYPIIFTIIFLYNNAYKVLSLSLI